MKLRPEPATKKPRLALLLATGFGLGRLPLAPGSWGSLGGVTLAWAFWRFGVGSVDSVKRVGAEVLRSPVALSSLYGYFLALALAAVGVWAGEHAAKYLGSRDPQVVVIDEISGQHLTLLAGLGGTTVLNWKYLLLGFILFRVFDIWKPFPVRHAERLPGGWGIMADDWVAAIYAALGLWLARSLGLYK